MTISETKTTIEIADNHHEAILFIAWLINQGYDASMSVNDANYYGGECCNTDAHARSAVTRLWDKYCQN